MPTWTHKELGEAWGVTDKTIWNWIKKLEKKRKFKKTALGQSLNDVDVMNLSNLLGMKLPEKKSKL